jgi:transposase
LPPYSPDLNPIEEAFAELKAWCKKHYTEAQRMEFEEFLEHALENVKDNACNHFSRSQIGLPIREGSDEDYWDD